MNETYKKFTLNELAIGQKEQFDVLITESLINQFAEISGDFNPLHMKSEYAKQNGFAGRVCHGMLLSSFFSRLVGMYLPGIHALYFSQSLNFKNPCYINDKITIEGEILDKSDASKILTLKTIIKKDSGEIVVEGNAKVIVRNHV
ncbi:MAG: enoyl-CoA hydratase [Crenarchaeota archaeon]|nr:MAG: enoyl-CoA hydratase [Thermoproteota archaeon]RDJ33324.1 MAG: enoyl-CoA hydratase [Thermoproteota archaeon]RDJ36173.1 MAG: enoyl-CoA hydratase [Thermoproteota archaeon]RDJ38804.1 MAG: enoyl-CoA hydratase [Thermoproteota archaeon]